ncbi:YheC/YheD family protein [Mesobacillus harenae]|uniref:YheC/YheD family protein n=1 Tax=Mesobacillus harenae TaxID=2213203 RepID=UPI003BB1BA86
MQWQSSCRLQAICLKDENQLWKCIGWIGRCGIPGSIVSNRSSGGNGETGYSVLASLLGTQSSEVKDIKDKLFGY